MKKYYTSKKLKISVVILINLVFSLGVVAQQGQGSVSKYRVIAHQMGMENIQSVSNTITVIERSKYYIPNAFTPNGDGLNDTFGIIGKGITNYHLQIYNRWGNLIFESTDTQVQWDGSYLDELVPEGTYVYKITGRGERAGGVGEEVINASGTVTLVDSAL